jgi:hypothetical protein
VVLLANGVSWTCGVEAAVLSKKVASFRDELVAALLAVSQLLNRLTTGLQRSTLAALITYDVRLLSPRETMCERARHLRGSLYEL